MSSEELLKKFVAERRSAAMQIANKEEQKFALREADGLEAALLSKTNNDTIMCDTSDPAYMSGWNFGSSLLMW